MKRAFVLASAIFLLVCSCSKEPDNPPAQPGRYENGVFIVNEGIFNTGTGTISFLKRDSREVHHKIYQLANQLMPLGNIVQSMQIINGTVFIAVNNSAKVELAGYPSFVSVETISDIAYPSFIIEADSSKAYISCWDNTIQIIDTRTFARKGQIPAGKGPTRMAKIGDKVWVLNQGGFDVDSAVSVIDAATDQLVATIQVYPRPTGIRQDKTGRVWVLCSGRGAWQGGATAGRLVSIDTGNYSIVGQFIFPDIGKQPEQLAINAAGDILYYSMPDGIYRFHTAAAAPEATPFIKKASGFYSFDVDPFTDVIYASDAVDFVQAGWVFRYNADDGSAIDSVQAGIVPSEFFFVP